MNPTIQNLKMPLGWSALLCVLAVLSFPALAGAHGSSAAAAKQPTFNGGTLRLVGVGGYGTERKHASIRVTVCLSKRYGANFFNVRCNTAYSSKRKVKAKVSVPGCVKGVWRTTAFGEAQAKTGEWTHAASSTSANYRC